MSGRRIKNILTFKKGLAEVAVYEDTKYQAQFEEIEAEAKEAGRGIWSER